jgi:transposase
MALLMAARKSGQGSEWRTFVPTAAQRYAEKTGVKVNEEAVKALKAWWEEFGSYCVLGSQWKIFAGFATVWPMRPHGSAKVLEARRRIAARLLAEGNSLTEVAAAVGSSPSSVLRWRDALQENGDSALDAKPHPGRSPYLNGRQRDRLLDALAQGALVWGFHTPEWNCPRVKAMIERLFGISYNVDYVGTLLHKWRWSVHKTEMRARERDETAIEKWRREEWPRLKKEASSGC